jgi:hypothetical protein
MSSIDNSEDLNPCCGKTDEDCVCDRGLQAGDGSANAYFVERSL